LAELPRDRPIAFICLTGRRAVIAALLTRPLGFDAHNIEGGLVAWRAEGLPFSVG